MLELMNGDGAKRDIFVPHQLSEMDKPWKQTEHMEKCVDIDGPIDIFPPGSTTRPAAYQYGHVLLCLYRSSQKQPSIMQILSSECSI